MVLGKYLHVVAGTVVIGPPGPPLHLLHHQQQATGHPHSGPAPPLVLAARVRAAPECHSLPRAAEVAGQTTHRRVTKTAPVVLGGTERPSDERAATGSAAATLAR